MNQVKFQYRLQEWFIKRKMCNLRVLKIELKGIWVLMRQNMMMANIRSQLEMKQ